MKFPSFPGAFAGILILNCLYLSGCKKTESTTAAPTADLSCACRALNEQTNRTTAAPTADLSS